MFLLSRLGQRHLNSLEILSKYLIIPIISKFRGLRKSVPLIKTHISVTFLGANNLSGQRYIISQLVPNKPTLSIISKSTGMRRSCRGKVVTLIKTDILVVIPSFQTFFLKKSKKYISDFFSKNRSVIRSKPF